MITRNQFGVRAGAVLVPVCLLACSAAIGQDAATAEDTLTEAAAELEAAGAEVEAAADAAAEAVESAGDAVEAAGEAADAAVEAAGDAVEAAGEAADAAGEAVDAAQDVAAGAVEAAGEAADEAGEAVDAAQDVAADAVEAAGEAADAAGEAVDAAQDVAAGAVEAAGEAADEAGEAVDAAQDAAAGAAGAAAVDAVAGAADEAAAAESSDDVIVTVNGTDFTVGEANEAIEKRMSAFAAQIPPGQLEGLKTRMKDQVVDDFVNRTLLEGEVTKNGVTVEDAEVDEFIETAKEGLPEGFTLEQFLEQRGLNIEDMRRDVGFQLAAKKLIDDQLGDKLTVTDAEIEEFFEREKARFGAPEQVHARHILVKVDPSATDEDKAAKKQQIDALREKVVGGEDFAAVAASDSDCPSGQQGGDLGTFDRTRMVPPFAEAAFSQEIGAVGDVIETQFGYHFIEVLEKTEAVEASLDDTREQIVNVLQNQRRGDAFQTYMQGLRDGSEIVYPGQ